GFDALDAALAMRREKAEKDAYRTPLPRQRLSAKDWDLAADLLTRLRDAFAGFGPEGGDPEGPLTALAANHRRVVEALLAGVEGEESSGIDDGSYEELFALFDEFALQGEGALKGRFRDYPSFFGALAQSRVVKPNSRAVHRRIKVLGPLEARLLHIDRVVLGGLDEGVWPPKTQTDAFLNRPMRAGIGLLPPERRIGQTAHDFVQAAGAREVVVTRARKRNGAPTVASRFLQRLKAFVGEDHWGAMLGEGERLRFLARRVDVDTERPPLRRPNPKPDPALFPRSLSVTEIETLVRDPYSIFAKHVLKLHALEGVGVAPSAAERGTIVHEVFAKFVEAFPIDLPDIAVARARIAELLGRELNPYIESFPDIHADWLPRLQRLTNAFVEWEYERRAMLATILVERSGKLAIPMGSEYFTLRARADRIERKRDGGVVAVDFKTGQLPSMKEIGVGFSPQLTLEAAMLMRGAFPDAGTVEETPELLYLRTSGGKEPIEPCVVKPGRDDQRSMDEIVEQHYAQLVNLVAQFIAGDIGYMSRPSAKYAKKYNDYDHLALVKEWSATGGIGGDDS
ncbi:MAG TPA: double-strand break repair protein AddB, partial [Saliniramus sp.]|nr:double-strand break repair protein AddB [Saliniramus sp.]